MAPPAPAASVPLRMTFVQEAVAALGTQQPLPHTGVTPAAGQSPAPPPPPVAVAPVPPPPAGHARVMEAVGRDASSGNGDSPLDAAIEAFEAMAAERYAEPVLFGDDIIPMETLLYRGRAALERAIELRNTLRGAGVPDRELLEELYDLVELARTD
jgi:hypothetical protein